MFPEAEPKTTHLGIPDDYEFMDPDLIEELQYAVPEALKGAR